MLPHLSNAHLTACAEAARVRVEDGETCAFSALWSITQDIERHVKARHSHALPEFVARREFWLTPFTVKEGTTP